MATNGVSVHGTYIALEPSLDGKEPTAFKAVVLSSIFFLVRVYREGVFTAETRSSQRSEYFLIKNSLLRALGASAVSHPQA